LPLQTPTTTPVQSPSITAVTSETGPDGSAVPTQNARVSELMIITGPPGSGKSTVARLVVERFDRCVLVAGDAFFGFVARGYIDPWLPESHPQNVVVTEAAARATGRYPRGGYMTIYDGMVGPWFLRTFLEYADLERVHYGVLMPPLEVCLTRVLGREDHGFRDEGATRHMYASFADALIEERHVFRNAGDEPSTVAQEVLLRFERRELVYPSAPDALDDERGDIHA
jgi:hypothetical protein